MEFMDILIWVVFGGLVGWAASKIMKTDQQQGMVTNVIVGIVGAIIGGFLASQLGQPSPEFGFNVYGFVVALIGAVLLLWVVKLFRNKS